MNVLFSAFCFIFWKKKKEKKKRSCNQNDTSPETMIGFRIQCEYCELSFLWRSLRLDLFGINLSLIISKYRNGTRRGMTAAINQSRQGSLVVTSSRWFEFCNCRASVTPRQKRNETEYSSGSQWANKRRVVCHQRSTVGAHRPNWQPASKHSECWVSESYFIKPKVHLSTNC